jgi:transcriptional regulator with XRE-family HTH domain
MEIMKIIRQKRIQEKLTQEYMGEKLGMAKETYRNIENGHIRLKVDDFVEICKILHLSPAAVLSPDDLGLPFTKDDIESLKKAAEALNKIEKLRMVQYIKKEDNEEISRLRFSDSDKTK